MIKQLLTWTNIVMINDEFMENIVNNIFLFPESVSPRTWVMWKSFHKKVTFKSNDELRSNKLLRLLKLVLTHIKHTAA